MERVGVRELKARLSHHLKRVRAGQRLIVTERGRPVATLAPVEARADADIAWLHRLVAAGQIRWSGGKPKGSAVPVKLKGKKLASDYVIEDRG